MWAWPRPTNPQRPTKDRSTARRAAGKSLEITIGFSHFRGCSDPKNLFTVCRISFRCSKWAK